MPVATEISYLVLKEGVNPEDGGSHAAEQWKKGYAVLRQQKGFIRVYWGLIVEDPKILITTVDWEAVQDHKDFVNSEGYLPFMGTLSEIFDFSAGAPLFYHVNFTGDSLAAREAPVTEFAPFHIAVGADDQSKSNLEDAGLKVTSFCMDSGSTGTVVGWAIEELDHSDAPEGKTKLLQALIGWESIEAHMAARGKSEFPELIKPVRVLTIPSQPGQHGKHMFHVKLQKFETEEI